MHVGVPIGRMKWSVVCKVIFKFSPEWFNLSVTVALLSRACYCIYVCEDEVLRAVLF